MNNILKNLITLVLVILWMGGIACGIIFAIQAKALVPGIAIVALGVMAFPVIKKRIAG